MHETTEGEAGPQGGRKPVLLTLNRSYGCVVGIEMRPESYNAVAVDLEGSVIYSKFELVQVSARELPRGAPRGGEPGARRAEAHGRAAARHRRRGGGRGGPPARASSGTPSRCRSTESFDFQPSIADGYDLPIFVENDANACAWGELAFHRGKRLRNFLFVLVEFRDLHDRGRIHERTGVGMGIVIGGRVHYGRDFSAGEFRSVFRTPENKGQFSLSEEDAFRLEEDPAVLARFFRELSRNIAMLVNTFNLDHVFLGGDIERYEREIQPVLAEEIQFNWPYPGGVRCDDPLLLARREGGRVRRRGHGAAPAVRGPRHRREHRPGRARPAGRAGDGRAPARRYRSARREGGRLVLVGRVPSRSVGAVG